MKTIKNIIATTALLAAGIANAAPATLAGIVVVSGVERGQDFARIQLAPGRTVSTRVANRGDFPLGKEVGVAFDGTKPRLVAAKGILDGGDATAGVMVSESRWTPGAYHYCVARTESGCTAWVREAGPVDGKAAKPRFQIGDVVRLVTKPSGAGGKVL